MQRRDFLRSLTGACCAAGTLMLDPLRPHFRLAHAATGKTLVAIFQRGGCDGLNTVVPYGEDEYYHLRPTLAIDHPNTGNPEAALDLNGFFGLHPGLAALAPIYQAGSLAILPTVHYPSANRSHFDSQAFIESGATTKYPDGWLNRHLAMQPVSATLRAVGFGNTLVHSLQGAEIVSAFNNLESFSFGLTNAEDTALRSRLAQVYNQPIDFSRAYREDTHDFGQAMLHDLDVIKGLNPEQYSPANGAVYPETAFGQATWMASISNTSRTLPVALPPSIPIWDHS
jgi:uncharacterized protein (DUF1501 family)